jgi:hypothetical protein
MTIDGNVGADASLLLSAADLASANARAGQGGGGSGGLAGATGAIPSPLTAPSSVVLAAALATSVSGVLDVSFDLYFQDSAPDTITILVQEITHATAMAGGAVNGGWRIENGGTPVTVTGDAPQTIEVLTKSVTTGALVSSFNARFMAAAPLGEQVGFQLVISAAHNLSAMVFNGVAKQI